MIETNPHLQDDIWFVYDGDCPICSMAARTWQIRKAIGSLHLINARLDHGHFLLKEIRAKELNLDDGMVIKFGDNYYHGADALHIMALLGTDTGWFNRLNVMLFRSKTLSMLCYPAMRAVRNLALRIKGVPKIRNLESGS